MELLQQRGIQAFALVRLDLSLFELLLKCGCINEAQFDLLCAYIRDPEIAMDEFLQRHPDFLKEALTSNNERIASRARLFAEKCAQQSLQAIHNHDGLRQG
jgi:hypothetical protein